MRQIFPILLLLLAGTAWAAAPQRTENVTSRVGGAARGLEISLQVAEGRVMSFDYSGWQQVGRSAHDCGLTAARGDGQSTWRDQGSATTVSFADTPGTLTISREANGYTLVFAEMTGEGVCGAGASLPRRLTLTRRGQRYVGRVTW